MCIVVTCSMCVLLSLVLCVYCRTCCYMCVLLSLVICVYCCHLLFYVCIVVTCCSMYVLLSLVLCVYCCHLFYVCIVVTCSMCELLYVCVAGFTVDAELLARSQYSEGPATGHLDAGFS